MNKDFFDTFSLSPSGNNETLGQPCYKPILISDSGLYLPDDTIMTKETLDFAIATIKVRNIVEKLDLDRILCMYYGGLIPTYTIIGSLPNALGYKSKIIKLDYSVNKEPRREKRLKKLIPAIENSSKIGLFEFRKSGITTSEYIEDFKLASLRLNRSLEVHIFGFLDDYYLTDSINKKRNNDLIFNNSNGNLVFQDENLIIKEHLSDKTMIKEYIITGVSKDLDDNPLIISPKPKIVSYLNPNSNWDQIQISSFEETLWFISAHQLVFLNK